MTAKITQFPKKKSGASTQTLEGFEYIKFTKDKNGISFRAEHLREYADKNKYTITILKENDKEVCLCDFYVKNTELEKFFKACFDGKIEGEIVEIEKCPSETMA